MHTPFTGANTFTARSAATILARFSIALLVAGGLCLALVSPQARAQTASSLNRQAPSLPSSGGGGAWITSAVASPGGRLNLFGGAESGYDYHQINLNAWNGSTWSRWSALSNASANAPAVVQLSSGSVVILQNVSGNLMANIGSGSPPVWQGWTTFNLGGLSLLSSPTAVSWGGNRVDVFAWISFYGGQIFHAWSTTGGTQWSWQLLFGVSNGNASYAPLAVSRGTNNIDLFADLTGGSLAYQNWNGSSWSGWQGIGGSLVDDFGRGTPNYAVVPLSSTQLDVFGVWTDNSLRSTTLTGSSWSAWNSLSGYLTSNPTATSWASGFLTVCALGGNNELWCRDDLGGNWTGWYSLGGHFGPGGADGGSTPVSVSTSNDMMYEFAQTWAFPGDTLDVYYRLGMWNSQYNKWAWAGWVSLGMPAV